MFKAIDNLRKGKGFTLIELLIVVAIIGILAAIAIPAYIGAQEKARKSNLQKAAKSAEADVQHWLNSAMKGSLVTNIGAPLREVDTNWDGQVTAADLNNRDLFLVGTNAADGTAECYAGARSINAVGSGAMACGQSGVAGASSEASPWAGMGGCQAGQALFVYNTTLPATTTDPGVQCAVQLAPASVALTGAGTNQVVVIGSSNGPGGSGAAGTAELLTRNTVTAE